MNEKSLTPKPKTTGVKKQRGAGTSGRFSDSEREQLYNHSSRLYLQGYSNYGIAKWINENTEFTVSQVSVSNWLGDILEDWHAERIEKIDKIITAQLMKLQKAQMEAWDAWERSKNPTLKKTSRKKGRPIIDKANPAKVSVTPTEYEDIEETIEQVGDFRFLDLYNRIVLQQLEILTKGGFDKPDNPGVYTGNTYNQQVVYIGVVDRSAPPPEVIQI